MVAPRQSTTTNGALAKNKPLNSTQPGCCRLNERTSSVRASQGGVACTDRTGLTGSASRPPYSLTRRTGVRAHPRHARARADALRHGPPERQQLCELVQGAVEADQRRRHGKNCHRIRRPLFPPAIAFCRPQSPKQKEKKKERGVRSDSTTIASNDGRVSATMIMK